MVSKAAWWEGVSPVQASVHVCMCGGGEQGRAAEGTGWSGGDGWVTEAGPSLALIMPGASNCISKHILFFFFFLNSRVWKRNFAAIEIPCAISFLGLLL